jgi:DNA-binding response OmpR family regulator
MAAAAAPDLAVLDLGLPGVPGETVARELHAAAPVPIVMLTARSAEEDRIARLELGADDYVTKPFSPRELVCGSRCCCAAASRPPLTGFPVTAVGCCSSTRRAAR